MTTVYFSGVNQHQWLEAMKGQCVLESFADIRPLADRYRGTWSGAMLDSGAFTEMTTGREIDLHEYTDFCLEHGAFYDAIVNLDDIRGDVDKSQRNLRHLLDAGINAMPVFHQGEPWSVLEDMASSFSAIGVGFRRPIRDADEWLDGVFSRAAGCSVHGFAMTAYMGRFPFHSVDSTSWLFEVRGLMALQSQGNPMRYQTPSELVRIVLSMYERRPKAERWHGRRPSEQIGLFEVE